MKSITSGAAIGTLPTPKRTGYDFKGWFTAATGGTQITTATKVTASVTYHARWAAVTCKVTLNVNAQGGTVSPASISVTYGAPIGGALPTPKRADYKFKGWYTAATSGTMIIPSMSITANVTAQWTSVPRRFVKAEPNGNNVKYYREDNSGVERSEGTRAWRNNNPGNVRGAANKIGLAGGFAVFADYDTGFKAIISLLKTSDYNNLSINNAILKYAPPSENDTANYQLMLKQKTGLDIGRKINSLTSAELDKVASAIQQIEGYTVGKETSFTAP